MYQMYKGMLDSELESYLKHMHHEQNMTLKEMSAKLGCSRANVSRLCKKLNIEVSNKKNYFDSSKYGFDNEESLRNKLIEWHSSGLNQKSISEKLNCRRQTVIELFKKFNIEAIHSNLLHIKCGFSSDQQLAEAVIKMYYDLNMSKRQIAEYFKVSIDPITWLFQRHNIISRSGSEVLELEYEKNDIIPTPKEMEIINGMLLGDGHIEIKRHTALLCYTCKYEEVTTNAAKSLDRFDAKSYLKTYRSGGVERSGYRMNTKSFPFFKKLRSIWTSKEGRPADLDKSPPPDIKLTPETCYWWYLGDGSTMKGCLKFCTHGFSRRDVEMLASKLPVETTVWEAFNKKQDKKYPIITINKQEERKKFLDFIGPCRHQCYSYKWRVLNSKGKDVR